MRSRSTAGSEAGSQAAAHAKATDSRPGSHPWRPGQAGAQTLDAADFFERTGDRAQMREMVGVLAKTFELNPPASPLPLALARHRLDVRLGRFKGKRPGALQLIGEDAGTHVWPVRDAPDNDVKWLVALTNDVDERGLHLFDGIPVTDTVRGQLEFFAALLVLVRRRNDREERALALCKTLIDAQVIGMRSGVRDGSGRDRGAIALVLSHVLRPATPRWYVPLSCVARETFGGTVRLASLVDDSRVPLPFSAPASFRTTKALSDFFAQLDQLGILQVALARLEGEEASGPPKTPYAALVRLYAAWRSVFFADADSWIARALKSLPENPDDPWYQSVERAVKSALSRKKKK